MRSISNLVSPVGVESLVKSATPRSNASISSWRCRSVSFLSGAAACLGFSPGSTCFGGSNCSPVPCRFRALASSRRLRSRSRASWRLLIEPPQPNPCRRFGVLVPEVRGRPSPRCPLPASLPNRRIAPVQTLRGSAPVSSKIIPAGDPAHRNPPSPGQLAHAANLARDPSLGREAARLKLSDVCPHLPPRHALWRVKEYWPSRSLRVSEKPLEKRALRSHPCDLAALILPSVR